jgi:glycosyltransferase involved in cell wall biosynthesis
MGGLVAVNCRVLSKPDLTGVGRYTARLVDALAEAIRPHDLRLALFGIESPPDLLTGRDGVENAGEPAWAHSGLAGHIWEQVWFPRAVEKYGADLLHTPAGHAPTLGDVPKITTVHDLSPVVHPEWFSLGYRALYRVLTPLTVRASDRVIAVSGFTAESIEEQYGVPTDRVRVVPNGVTRPPAGTEPTDLNAPDQYFLFVGSINPRKNVSRLLEAYRRYRVRVDDPAALVLAGPDRDVFASVDVEPTAGVETVGYVSDATLGWLFRHAIAFVYPSLYEGFGLPILEAMSVGTPVITADRGAMAETADDAALFISPESVVGLSDALVRIDEDRTLRERLSTAGRRRSREFSWERTAEETLSVYREVL